jgi:hypothetical protein
MTNHAPIEINGESFAANVVACPSCEAAIDAQRALIGDGCPECGTPPRGLVHGAEAPPDSEHDAHMMEAE